jgi:hypothetical protein
MRIAGSTQHCCNRITHIKDWEKKILRDVCLPVTEKGVWVIGTNQDIRELYESLDLAADIKRRSLNHVIQMYHTGMCKKTVESKP